MNKKYLLALVIIIIATVVLALTVANKPQQFVYVNNMVDEINQPTVTIGGETFKVELAQTPAERAQGLSGGDPLAEDAGMLFVFDEPAVYGFWMKDMKFALDIIWIMDGQVVDIWQNAPPPTRTDIPSYRPQVPAEYVLEVNAGFVERSGLNIGDVVKLDI